MSHLNDTVLVLNKSWTPVSVTTVKRSLRLLFVGSARFVCTETYSIFELEDWVERDSDRYIKSTGLAIPVPEVLVLSTYNSVPNDKSSFSKKNVYKRDRYLCQYCGEFPGIELLTIDHVIPKSRGGKSTWENCVVACSACNTRKSDKPLAESGMALLKEPVRPNWSPVSHISSRARKPSWNKFLRGK